MRLHLLRHGQTDWNTIRRLQGSVNTPLNETGLRQAEAWRPYFSRLQLAGIYSSSLERALHTASIATGRPACIIPGFDERGFGLWEGNTWDELRSSISEFDERWNEDLFCPPGGESRAAVYERVRSALSETVFAHAAGQELLIVAHGASGHAILGNLLETDRSRASLPVLHNASLTVLEKRFQGWAIVDQRLPEME